MNGTSKQKIAILRQRIPIGIQHALALLEKTNGDIDRAEVLFKEEMLDVIINKTGVAKDVAQRHLINNNYDIGHTLKSLDEERFTLIERIYIRYKDKEEALRQVMRVIEEQHHIERNYWLDFKTLLVLPQEICCPLVIMEWMAYEEYESFHIALSFQLDVVAAQIENVLQFPSLASTLRQAREIMELIYKEYEVGACIENYIAATNKLRSDKAYQSYEQAYTNQKSLLISRLYDFVKMNIKLIEKTG